MIDIFEHTLKSQGTQKIKDFFVICIFDANLGTLVTMGRF